MGKDNIMELGLGGYTLGGYNKTHCSILGKQGRDLPLPNLSSYNIPTGFHPRVAKKPHYHAGPTQLLGEGDGCGVLEMRQ